MIQNSDAISPNLTPSRAGFGTCLKCGVSFRRQGASKRCKPCASVHYDEQQRIRARAKAAAKRHQSQMGGE